MDCIALLTNKLDNLLNLSVLNVNKQHNLYISYIMNLLFILDFFYFIFVNNREIILIHKRLRISSCPKGVNGVKPQKIFEFWHQRAFVNTNFHFNYWVIINFNTFDKLSLIYYMEILSSDLALNALNLLQLLCLTM